MSKRIVCMVMTLIMILAAAAAFGEETAPEVQGENNTYSDLIDAATKWEEAHNKDADEAKTEDKEVRYVYLGTYEQDNNLENGPEPIEWIILDVVSEKKPGAKTATHKALLLSAYALDAQPYNTNYTPITWKQSTLRTWLNDDFLNTAFSEEEQAIIMASKADNSDDQGNNADAPETLRVDLLLDPWIKGRVHISDEFP